MASLSAAMNFEHGDGDEDYLPNGNESFVTNHRHLQELQRLSAFQQVTSKVPPSYDGRSGWVAYEDAIDDWCDITELDGDKRGPALRNRLEGEAAIHKRLVDRAPEGPEQWSEVLQELPASSLREGTAATGTCFVELPGFSSQSKGCKKRGTTPICRSRTPPTQRSEPVSQVFQQKNKQPSRTKRQWREPTSGSETSMHGPFR